MGNLCITGSTQDQGRHSATNTSLLCFIFYFHTFFTQLQPLLFHILEETWNDTVTQHNWCELVGKEWNGNSIGPWASSFSTSSAVLHLGVTAVFSCLKAARNWESWRDVRALCLEYLFSLVSASSLHSSLLTGKIRMFFVWFHLSRNFRILACIHRPILNHNLACYVFKHIHIDTHM